MYLKKQACSLCKAFQLRVASQSTYNCIILRLWYFCPKCQDRSLQAPDYLTELVELQLCHMCSMLGAASDGQFAIGASNQADLSFCTSNETALICSAGGSLQTSWRLDDLWKLHQKKFMKDTKWNNMSPRAFFSNVNILASHFDLLHFFIMRQRRRLATVLIRH